MASPRLHVNQGETYANHSTTPTNDGVVACKVGTSSGGVTNSLTELSGRPFEVWPVDANDFTQVLSLTAYTVILKSRYPISRLLSHGQTMGHKGNKNGYDY